MVKTNISGRIGSVKVKPFSKADGEQGTALRLSIASKRSGKADVTTWLDVVVWNGAKLAQYATVGRAVCISGELVCNEQPLLERLASKLPSAWAPVLAKLGTIDAVANLTTRYYELHADWNGVEFMDAFKGRKGGDERPADMDADGEQVDADEMLAGI